MINSTEWRRWVLVLVAALVPSLSRGESTGKPEVVSLLGKPLFASPPGGDPATLETNLETARAELNADPKNPAKIAWVGRGLGYLWRIHDAIEVYSKGIEAHPTYAPLYRHRGHRYITLRQFDKAAADLERAATLIEGTPDEIEEDGQPNAQNIPLTSTAFNVWYHLALARYLQGDFEAALPDWRETLKHCRGFDDNVVAVTDWMYMTLRRLGRDAEAAVLLEKITPNMEMIENTAYYRRLLMYKGLLQPEELLKTEGASELDVATYGYGVGNWHLCNGDLAKAVEVFERVLAGPYWPAFGYIASEVELARMRR